MLYAAVRDDTAEFTNQAKIKLTSQLIKDIPRVLQKLL